MKDKREYDIIIWGASGFTGRLVAEYLQLNYNRELIEAIKQVENKNIYLLRILDLIVYKL